MQQDNKSFDKLREAIKLKKAGRVNAAKATWAETSADFQRAVIEAAIAVSEAGNVFPSNGKWIKMNSPWGRFTFSQEAVIDEHTILLSDLVEVVVELVNG